MNILIEQYRHYIRQYRALDNNATFEQIEQTRAAIRESREACKANCPAEWREYVKACKRALAEREERERAEREERERAEREERERDEYFEHLYGDEVDRAAREMYKDYKNHITLVIADGLTLTANKTNSGIYGDAWEIACKYFLNGKRGNYNHVSARLHTDVIYHGYRMEIKSNCGEINDDIDKNDYIIYTMDNKTDYLNPASGRVMTVQQFKQLFETLGLIRQKKSSAGVIKTTIQTYKNSKKKSMLLAEALEQFETLEQWKAEH